MEGVIKTAFTKPELKRARNLAKALNRIARNQKHLTTAILTLPENSILLLEQIVEQTGRSINGSGPYLS